jgi:hypothetical protein
MNSSSRATSNMSNCEKQIISNMNTQKSIYHIPFNSIYLSNNKSYNENYNLNFEETMKRQSNYAVITPNSEFDHYSQVVAEVDDYTTNNIYEVQQRQDCYNDYRYSNVIGETYPYMLKTNNYYGSNITSSNDIHNVNNNNNESLKNIYRAVEYTKSSEGERVRVQNSENFNSATTNNIMELSEITQEIQTRNILLEEEEEQVEKTFVVKLFPMDENLKEVQEMSLFYEK